MEKLIAAVFNIITSGEVVDKLTSQKKSSRPSMRFNGIRPPSLRVSPLICYFHLYGNSGNPRPLPKEWKNVMIVKILRVPTVAKIHNY